VDQIAEIVRKAGEQADLGGHDGSMGQMIDFEAPRRRVQPALQRT
jgi:hypothetical protein